ncbi:hypothetical protein [Brevundimonas variabilis]|uniref:Lipoprotein n=1 Tax=Brevundimonas variabilis TaxID=74312 RepID=A0A7W9CHA4_9CAUL|nr:hypothetical protein [Brevundimonas variabilis]MBB5745187.1 hypothetical protein [Brevundimonas variabilis]
MRKFIIVAAATFALTGLAACGESAADKQAEVQADALEEQAAAAPTEAAETALNAEADRIEQEAGNADGGMTTANTPDTSPSTSPANPVN